MSLFSLVYWMTTISGIITMDDCNGMDIWNQQLRNHRKKIIWNVLCMHWGASSYLRICVRRLSFLEDRHHSCMCYWPLYMPLQHNTVLVQPHTDWTHSYLLNTSLNMYMVPRPNDLNINILKSTLNKSKINFRQSMKVRRHVKCRSSL